MRFAGTDLESIQHFIKQDTGTCGDGAIAESAGVISFSPDRRPVAELRHVCPPECRPLFRAKRFGSHKQKGQASTEENDLVFQMPFVAVPVGQAKTSAGIKGQILDRVEFPEAGEVAVIIFTARNRIAFLAINLRQHVDFAAEAKTDETVPFFMFADTDGPAIAAGDQVFAQECGDRQTTLVINRGYSGS